MRDHNGRPGCPACADRERDICGLLLALESDDEAAALELLRPYIEAGPTEMYLLVRRLAQLGLGWIGFWVSDTGIPVRDFLSDIAHQFASGETQ